ncbi:MAG: hypothetical protein R2795_22130 [Saprospiraceae bacterium]
MPALFADHDLTSFPLRGAHQQTDCLACHADGYAGTPTQCAACHINDYNNTANPNHAAAQFPLNCEECHNENALAPIDI